MHKALEILKEIRNIETNYDHCLKHRFDEAIAELEEAMKPKTCEGCVYEDKDGVINVECAFCLRNSNDNFKPKDNA